MIIFPTDRQHHHLLGGKATALAKLQPLTESNKCRIPAWFAVPAGAEISTAEIIAACEKIPAPSFAVRSSARGEDGAEHSFAGQYDSYLYVSPSDVPAAIRQVHNSHRSDHLSSYQASKNIQLTDQPTALVQQMIQPDVSGVAFSADPVTGRRAHAIVSALWGTGTAIVSGEADTDTWCIDQDGNIVATNIAHKTIHHTINERSNINSLDDRPKLIPEGTATTPTPPEKQDIPCLTEAQIKQVAALARLCACQFGCPQDIEWALADGELYLLQSRPITTLAHTPDPDDPLTVWDNSNIAESYSGITSPLTFSFAARIYEHVYREFCGLLSVPKSRIRANDFVFSQMLGHHHGHVYYNLNSWYHVLAMLPGFSLNRSFMEQMMGVKEPMPDEVVHAILKQTQTTKLKDTWGLLRTFTGLIRNQCNLETNIRKFYHRLNQALAAPDQPLTEMSATELRSHYHDLESKLLKRWDAPLVNDFFAMIYYGVLQSLCKKWLNSSSLHNQLLLDTGDIISAEPPRRINAMAAIAKNSSTLTNLLADPNASTSDKLSAISKLPELEAAYLSYLEKFGDRCLEELKLESPSVGENPQALLTSIGIMANRLLTQPTSTSEPPPPTQAPSPADIPALDPLTGIKRKLFLWVLRQAKDRVRDRENLRFERTRLFGRVRNIIRELGKRMQQDRLIDTADDIFWLPLQDAMNPSLTAQQLQTTIQSNKQHFDSFITPPPDRFETRGPLSRYREFTPTSAQQTELLEGDLSGIGACPGIVRGSVRVVTEPQSATLREGEILVAQQTDPGWVVLFPSASALLVERGSLLSHSAIVARELRLPCIVSIRNVTQLLHTGDIIEIDGSTGSIRIIEKA